jgi:uncharacterized membrane protein
MTLFSGGKSLWFDDLCQISMTWKVESLSALIANVLGGDNMPPLYHAFSALWLRVAPFGAFWLRLPSEVAAAAGIFLCGLAGHRWKGLVTGVATSLFAATSLPWIRDGAYAFRPYGFLLLFAAFALYSVVVRSGPDGRGSARDIVRLGVALTLLAYTHYFGVLLAGALFAADAALVLRRRLRPAVLLSYFAAAVAFAPWIVIALPRITRTLRGFWPEAPAPADVLSSLGTLFGLRPYPLPLIVLLTAAVLLAVRRIRKGKPVIGTGIDTYPLSAVLAWCIGAVVLSAYLYSAFLNPKASVYVDRYFLCLLPCAVLLLGRSTDVLLAGIRSIPARNPRRVVAALAACLFLVFGGGSWSMIARTDSARAERFQEAAVWLEERADLRDDGTLVVLTWPGEGPLVGWDYFLTRGGTQPGPARIPSSELGADRLAGVDKVYLFLAHSDMAPEKRKILESTFHRSDDAPDVDILVYTRIRRTD